MLKVAPTAFLLSIVVTQAHAATLYVDPSGNDSAPCSQAAPCASIQEAIDKAANKDTILVAPGTYNESLQISKNKLKLYSTQNLGATITGSGTPNALINITGHGVKIGRDNQGFVLNANTRIGINADNPSGRYSFIGNEININTTSNTDIYGIRTTGNRSKANRNKITFNGLGNYVIGSDVSVAGIQLFGLSNANARVNQNEIQCLVGKGGKGISIIGGEANNIKANSNTISDCPLGIEATQIAEIAGGIQIMNNLVQSPSDVGIDIHFDDVNGKLAKNRVVQAGNNAFFISNYTSADVYHNASSDSAEGYRLLDLNIVYYDRFGDIAVYNSANDTYTSNGEIYSFNNATNAYESTNGNHLQFTYASSSNPSGTFRNNSSFSDNLPITFSTAQGGTALASINKNNFVSATTSCYVGFTAAIAGLDSLPVATSSAPSMIDSNPFTVTATSSIYTLIDSVPVFANFVSNFWDTDNITTCGSGADEISDIIQFNPASEANTNKARSL